MAWSVSPGDVVMYRLHQDDVDAVKYTITSALVADPFGGFCIPKAATDVAGDVRPMMVVSVDQHRDPGGPVLVSGHVFLSGPQSLWVPAVVEGAANGEWKRKEN